MSPLHTVFKGYTWDVSMVTQNLRPPHVCLYSSCCMSNVSCFSYFKGAREPTRFPSSMKSQTWSLTLNHLLRATSGRNKKPTSYSLLNEGRKKKKKERNCTLFFFSSCLHWCCVWVRERDRCAGYLLTKLNSS